MRSLYYLHLKRALLLFLFISSCVPQTQGLKIPISEIKNNPIEDNCVYITSLNDFSSYSASTLLVRGAENTDISFYKFPSNINEEINTDIDSIYDFSISPNGELIAFVLLSESPPFEFEKLVILKSTTNTPIKEFDWKLEWGRLDSWLNDSNLILFKSDDLQPHTFNPKSVIILDIYAGLDKEISTDYPDINIVNYVNWNWVNLIFSPDFSMVMYPLQKVDEGYINYVAQWDISNEKILAEIPVALNATTIPKWSSDGQRVLIAGLVSRPSENLSTWQSQELFVIDENGQIEQLTNFSEFYGVPVWISNYAWSPNENHVAFWLEVGQLQVPQLVIFDMKTKMTTNYCISSAPYRDSSSIFWSPTGDMIAINYRRSKDDYFEPLLIDIFEKTAFKIDKKFYILGWLDTP